MTLKQKREIVMRFKRGESMGSCAIYVLGVRYEELFRGRLQVEEIIRDYMNQEFALEGHITLKQAVASARKVMRDTERRRKRERAKSAVGGRS